MRVPFLIFLFFLKFSVFAQVDSLSNISDFTIDKLGKCYAIRGSEIMKLDTSGTVLNTFSKKDYGNPFSLDARDPLRLLIFYRDFGVIRILDNQMAEQSVINLRQLGFSDPKLICGSVDQGIWIYDQASAQLVNLDVRLQKNVFTIDLRQTLGREINPVKMEQSQNWLILQNDKEILLFDQYGTYVRSLTLSYSPLLFQLNDDLLISGAGEFTEVNNLRIFNSSQKIKSLFPLDIEKGMCFNDQCWYLKNQQLHLIRQ